MKFIEKVLLRTSLSKSKLQDHCLFPRFTGLGSNSRVVVPLWIVVNASLGTSATSLASFPPRRQVFFGCLLAVLTLNPF